MLFPFQPMMDRNKADDLPKLQCGFIDFVCAFVYKVRSSISISKQNDIWDFIDLHFYTKCSQDLDESPSGSRYIIISINAQCGS